MKLRYLLGWSSALCLSALIAQAQETNGPVQFENRLRQMQDKFEQQQREMKESFERMIREQQAEIQALKQQIANATNAVAQQLSAATNALAATASTNPPVTADQLQEVNQKVDQVVEAQKKSRPGEFNPSIGFVGETIFSYRSRGAEATGSDRLGGFDVFQRSMELDVAASVDPFATAYAVINGSADAATGEANLTVEEAAIQTTSLPWNLTLKAGRFFGEYGRLAYIHNHELPFVNRPLVLDSYIGGESRTDGAQLNWLPPLPHYTSLTLGVGNQFGETLNNSGGFRSFGALNFFGRASTYFDLSPDWQFETGLSGLWNPRTDDRGGVLVQPNGSTLTEKERRVVDLDFQLRWFPLRNNEFKGFVWGTELLFSDNSYLINPTGSLNPANPVPGPGPGDHIGNVGSLGLYSYATYKWHRQWSGGFLFNWVQSPQNHDIQTFSYSPYLTWAISHWNQLRLQYTHTDQHGPSGLKPDDAVYLQWVWIIGSHSHGWQAR